MTYNLLRQFFHHNPGGCPITIILFDLINLVVSARLVKFLRGEIVLGGFESDHAQTVVTRRRVAPLPPTTALCTGIALSGLSAPPRWGGPYRLAMFHIRDVMKERFPRSC